MSNDFNDSRKEQLSAATGSVLQHIGKYQIRGSLGRGSTGIVYLGYDPQLQRLVAIKVLHVARAGSGEPAGDFQSSQHVVKRFMAEAQSAGRLRHQNIIALYEGDVHGPVPFLVMEYVEGKTLDVLIKSGQRFSTPDLIVLLRQLADAIDYAHSQGVLHRDIKPANILIDDDKKPYILDFGVAKIHEQISAEDEGVRATSVLGTPAYMSPEQIRNKPLNNQSDLFAFAIVAFQCLCGIRPFDGDTFTTVAASILEKSPKLASFLRPELSSKVDQVFIKALAKVRSGRYESGHKFIDALEQAMNSTASIAAIEGDFNDANTNTREIAKDAQIVRSLASTAPILDPKPPRPKSEAFSSKKIRKRDPGTQMSLKEGSSLSFILFALGMLIGVASLLAYAFWPRRTVVVFAGETSETEISVNQRTENQENTEQAQKLEEEAQISANLVQQVVNESADSDQLQTLIPKLRERARFDNEMDVTPLLKHSGFLVRVSALKILIDRRDSGAVQQILPLLDDRDPLVRGFAAKALGVLANGSYSEILAKKAANEEVLEVLRALENAMERIKERG